MDALRYLILSLALGGLSVWASENFFWTIPPPDLGAGGFVLTVIAYSTAVACALSAAIWAGTGGLAGAFLGGLILGYVAEGVIVGTMYQALPLQLIWTPMAWHATLTGGIVLGLGRAGAALGPLRMALIWTALGVAGAYWAQYWPSERGDLPDPARHAVYIAGFALLVPVAHLLMDRMGSLPRPGRRVLLIAPILAGSLWLLQGIAAPDPARMTLPVLLVLILWVMRRLGNGGVVGLGTAVPPWQHFLFLIAPVVAVTLGWVGWMAGADPRGANWVIAILSSLAGLLWFGVLIWRAARRGAV